MLIFLGFIIAIWILAVWMRADRKREMRKHLAQLEKFKLWQHNHPNHALSQKVEALLLEAYNDLTLNETDRLTRINTVLTNARRQQLEIEPEAPVVRRVHTRLESFSIHRN